VMELYEARFDRKRDEIPIPDWAAMWLGFVETHGLALEPSENLDQLLCEAYRDHKQRMQNEGRK